MAYGEGSIILAGSKPIMDVPVISTGSIALDKALGVWGMPKGRIAEIFGPEGSGKTTLCLSIVKNAQMAGGTAAFVDAEHALDLEWARKIGVDIDKLLISQPSSGEEALNIVEMLAASSQIDVIVIDSVAALVPLAEIAGDVGDHHIGAHARLMSQGMRKLTGIVGRSNCAVIFINQIRMKIGVMFGNPETTPGGRALKFYSSVRIDIRRQSAIKEGDENVGSELIVKIPKNKVAPPFKKANCQLYFGMDGYPSGIDYASSLVKLAAEEKIIDKQGAWYSYGELRLGQGFTKACAFVRDNADIAAEIESKIKGVEVKPPDPDFDSDEEGE